MKEILIPLNITTTTAVYDTKQSFSSSDEASGVLTFTTTADVAGTVASLTIRNASENANRQTVLIDRLDVNSSPFSYALKKPLSFGQYEGTVLLKKNLTVIASVTFLFGVNSSLSAEVLPDLVKAYSLDELVENVETEVSYLKDAFNLTVRETVKGVNKTESSLQAQENVRYLNEHQRKANELERIANENARVAVEVERKDTFDALVDSEVIEQTVVQEVANEFQQIESTYANRLLSTEQQLAERGNKTKYLFEADLTDITSILSGYMSDSNVGEIDLLKKEYVVSSPLTITKKIKNGSIRFKNTGSFTVKNGGFLEHFTAVMDTATLTSEAVIIYDGVEGKGDYIRIKPTNAVAVDTIGIHFKGKDLTCFNEVNNVHITYARKGVYIDSTVGWVTAITMNNVRVDYFEEFAFKIGSDSGDIQNSQHNINNLIIQDTSDSTEASNRIGLSLGGTWNNVNNLVTFADRPQGTFTPLEMPDKTDKTVNHLLAYLKAARNNKLNGAILENNPNFNGLEYLHSIENVRLLRNSKIGTEKTSWTLPSTNRIKPLFTLKDNSVFVPNSYTKTKLIDAGNLTVTQTPESFSIKNNTGSALSGTWDIKIPSKFVSKVQQGKYSTVLLQVENGNYGIRARDSAVDITPESINHLGTTPDGRISYYAFHNDDTIKQAASVDDLHLRIGFSSLPANTTVIIKGLQYYNQLVPIINENTIDWIGTTNLLS